MELFTHTVPGLKCETFDRPCPLEVESDMECTDAQPQPDYYAVPLTQTRTLPSQCTDPESDPDETMVPRHERYTTGLHGDTDEGAHEIEDDPVVDPIGSNWGNRVQAAVVLKRRRRGRSRHQHRNRFHLPGPYLAQNACQSQNQLEDSVAIRLKKLSLQYLKRKPFKSIIDFSDIKDSSDDEDFNQSHPRKRPIPRSPGQENISGFNSGLTTSLPDLSLPPTDHGPDSINCSDAIILIDDDDDSYRAGTSTYNNLILPISDDPDSSTCSYYSTNEDDDFNRAGTSSYNRNLDHVTAVEQGELPVKMDILWSKRLTSAAGQCTSKLDNDRRYSVIELSEKVCDSAERVRDILVHEMCHAACWIFFDEGNDDHGPMWQALTRWVNRIHPELPEVTERHDYNINYNYNYKCSQCDKQIGRFRKIPDNKCYCRQCGGRLHQLSIS
ncbi:unnamed protein product [Ranitomeya imitator]|uniref:SprT-like domain-containing protein n=1 Tax=Ranitomeya imitator TaxID=111125 RepID=A0ABN9KR34_9NEOB|nr:unnamed protein product [Ranitomeya imitator]